MVSRWHQSSIYSTAPSSSLNNLGLTLYFSISHINHEICQKIFSMGTCLTFQNCIYIALLNNKNKPNLYLYRWSEKELKNQAKAKVAVFPSPHTAWGHTNQTLLLGIWTVAIVIILLHLVSTFWYMMHTNAMFILNQGNSDNAIFTKSINSTCSLNLTRVG